MARQFFFQTEAIYEGMYQKIEHYIHSVYNQLLHRV